MNTEPRQYAPHSWVTLCHHLMTRFSCSYGTAINEKLMTSSRMGGSRASSLDVMSQARAAPHGVHPELDAGSRMAADAFAWNANGSRSPWRSVRVTGRHVYGCAPAPGDSASLARGTGLAWRWLRVVLGACGVLGPHGVTNCGRSAAQELQIPDLEKVRGTRVHSWAGSGRHGQNRLAAV